MESLINIIIAIISMAAYWMIFRKMGRQGWEGIIPFYNFYIICEELYGSGWKCLKILIPIYNIYFLIKLHIDLAREFNKSTGFAIGMLFLPFIFSTILAFGNSQYKDGSKENEPSDIVYQMVEKTREVVSNVTTPKPQQRDDNALEKINQLAELKDKGIITEEEFQEKKAELLSKI